MIRISSSWWKSSNFPRVNACCLTDSAILINDSPLIFLRFGAGLFHKWEGGKDGGICPLLVLFERHLSRLDFEREFGIIPYNRVASGGQVVPINGVRVGACYAEQVGLEVNHISRNPTHFISTN